MKTIGYILYQPYKWLVFTPLMIVFSLIASFLAVVLSVTINQRIGSKIGGSYWSRLIGFITPMFVKVTGRNNIDNNQSYIIISNHQSAFDIFLLYGWLGVDFRWIMKKELRKIFAIGYACEKVGHIFIDRSSPKAAFQSLEHAKYKLVNGTSVVIFPEGTRTGSNNMRPFKRGAFKMAYDLGLPILPVSIVDTHKIFGNGFYNLHPGTVKLHIHQPINVEFYQGKDSELMNKVFNTISDGIK
ncbi:MAG: 1-acyl-sn-glycerol-3-phosphate acyltransferase [Marinilabiliaceae bacterium]|nr:1-acyl-sn-glycerol-3-phosphate acyltransferase [Marinilabiliaceae bacterium]